MLFWSPLLLLCKARSPNTLRTPRFSHLESLWRKFNISLIDRSLANGLQAFAGERYTCTRKIPIDDSRSSPPPTVPNPQRRSAGLKCKSKYKKVGVLPIYTQYDVWRFERSFSLTIRAFSWNIRSSIRHCASTFLYFDLNLWWTVFQRKNYIENCSWIGFPFHII